MTITLDFENQEQLKHLKSLIDILYDTDFYINSAPEMKKVLDTFNKEVDREIKQQQDGDKPDQTLKHRNKKDRK